MGTTRNNDAFTDDIDYKVRARIDKYNTKKAYEEGKVDEVLEMPGNCLTNQGINLLWALVAGDAPGSNPEAKVPYTYNFDNQHSFIGIGNAGQADTFETGGWEAAAEDTGLLAGLGNTYIHNPNAKSETDASNKGQYVSLKPKYIMKDPHYVYMGMDADSTTYPIAGSNQKIVFKSTFAPGVACFFWFEWTVANGNGNPTQSEIEADYYMLYKENDPWTDAAGASATPPDAPPQIGTDIVAGEGGQDNICNLNHRYESMGIKYPAATWVVTVEISLS